MNMAINVYEYGRGGKCEYMFKYTYAGKRGRKMQVEKEDRHTYEQGYAYISSHRAKGVN